VNIFPNIERGPMTVVNGIVVQQTHSTEASQTFNSYRDKGANGAHFLIDKDGTIYQTSSLYKVTNHVGYLQSPCVKTLKCTPTELMQSKKATKLTSKGLTLYEIKKDFPSRYPYNGD
jgi:hypothetical protein